MDHILIDCPNCSKRLRVRDVDIRRRGTCNFCGHTFNPFQTNEEGTPNLDLDQSSDQIEREVETRETVALLSGSDTTTRAAFAEKEYAGSSSKPMDRFSEISDIQIAQAVVKVLKHRPNHSIKRDSLATEVLNVIGINTRGAPRKQFNGRLTRLLHRLKKSHVIVHYVAKNQRVRLHENHDAHLKVWIRHQPGARPKSPSASVNTDYPEQTGFDSLDFEPEILFDAPDLSAATRPGDGQSHKFESNPVRKENDEPQTNDEPFNDVDTQIRLDAILSQPRNQPSSSDIAQDTNTLSFSLDRLATHMSAGSEFRISATSSTRLEVTFDGLTATVEYSPTFRTLVLRIFFPYQATALDRLLYTLPGLQYAGALGLARRNGANWILYFHQIDIVRFTIEEVADTLSKFFANASHIQYHMDSSDG